MSYSLNTTGRPTAATVSEKNGSGNGDIALAETAAATAPMKKMPPRVILHPNGRVHSTSPPIAQRIGRSKQLAAAPSPSTPGAAVALGVGNGNGALARGSHAPYSSGNSPVASATPPPPGVTAAIHTMQTSSNPNAFATTSLPSHGNSNKGTATEEQLRKTEEQMAALQRKLSAIHADIRRLSPATSPVNPPIDPVNHHLASNAKSSAKNTVVAAAAVKPLSPGNSSRTSSSGGAVPPATLGGGHRAGGANHHLSPLPTPQPASALAPATHKTAPAALVATHDRKLSLDGDDFLQSPGGSSSDDDSSSSSSSSLASDSNENNRNGRAKGAVVGGLTPAKPAASPNSAAPPARQGFGFKRPDKPAGTAAAAADAPAKLRGANLFGCEPTGEEDKAKTQGKKAGIAAAESAAGPASPGSALVVNPVVGRAGGKRLSDEDGAGGGGRRGKLFSTVADDDVSSHDNAQAVDGLGNTSRKLAQAVKTLREQFFAVVPRQDEVLGDKATDHDAVAAVRLPGTPCSWLCCISLAVSFVTGVPTTVEKVLRANHLGVHHLGLEAITLPQLYDLTNDYIHSRFHRSNSYNANCEEDEFDDDEEGAQHLSEEELKLLPHVHCEMATMNNEVIDPVEESEASYGMGEHAPVTSLAQFRKELVAHNHEEHSLFIFHYDPYVIEEYETRLRANNAETEEEGEAIWANMLYKKGISKGAFGILLSFNPVRATVTIVSPHITKDQFPMRDAAAGTTTTTSSGSNSNSNNSSSKLSEETKRKLERFAPVLEKLVLEEHTISLQTLYEATRQRDAYTQLSRGFVRVFVSKEFAPKVPSIFPLYVLDGSSAAGLMTSTLDVSVAPHVLGLAMVHHLSITFLLSDNARRKQSSRNLLNKANVCDVKLRGIPLTKIIQQLRLPVSMIVASSNKESIAMAYAWYTMFLQQLQVNSDVRLGLVRPARRGGADDGQPNIDEDEFLAHLKAVVSTQSVMLISFDVNVALNVRINSNPEPAHFAIVVGLDEERGVVRLADVNVKRFRKTWHIPFYRLYNAVMGYGYMIAAKDKKTIQALKSKKVQEEVLQCGRYALPPMPNNAVARFEYPAKAYAVTVLADAVNRLGFRADVERFLNYSGFHISFFLSKHLPLEAAAFVTQNYSHYALDDALSVETKHYDYTIYSSPPTAPTDATTTTAAASASPLGHLSTEEELLADIEHALASPTTRQLVVKFDRLVIERDTKVFNGSTKGGCYAIVVDYDAATRSVVLSNGDPVSFYRIFAVPLPLLFEAISVWDNEDMRALGTMLLTSEQSQESMYDNTKGYDFAHALVHHPFRPVFSATCACLALAATELMMNIEAPTMLCGAPLAVEDEEKRKYKRYNNIFSAEDILYALPSFSVHAWQSSAAAFGSGDAAAMANTAFKQLRLPLTAIDVTNGQGLEEEGSSSASGPGAANVLTDPVAFLRACNGVSGLLTITLLVYDTGKLYGVPGTSMGVVNRVEIYDDEDEDEEDLNSTRSRARVRVADSKGTVQLLEGEPCRWGAMCERSAEQLMPCVMAILCVMEVIDEEDQDNI